jgi:hypothetical protein
VSLVVLVPAHDEAARIAETVRAALALPGVDRVLVVDDASSDRTSPLAEEAGAEVIRMLNNVGKGTALDAGLTVVRDDADVLLLLDGDLGESASQAALLLEPIVRGEADMTIAAFPPAERPAGFGLVKSLARWGIRMLSGTAGRAFAAAAPLSGQRAMTRECWERATPFAFGYGVEVALTVRALRSGMRVVEVPTTMSHAASGRDGAGFAHRGTQFVHVALAIAQLALERRAR